MAASERKIGGVIHTYQKFDPVQFPPPNREAPDLVSPAFEHLLQYGDLREFSEEELRNAIRIDPSQIAGFMPNMRALRELLEERKRKILETYETKKVTKEVTDRYQDTAAKGKPPEKLNQAYREAVRDEQLFDLENLYYRTANDQSPFARHLVQLTDILGKKIQIEEMASKYEFTGKTRLSIETAIEIRAELEEIDRLLKQLQEAAETGQLGIIDLDELREYVSEADVEGLRNLQQQIDQMIRRLAEEQGIEGNSRSGFQMTPKAYRLFQSRVLTQIFTDLRASRTGRHEQLVVGEGATESPATKPYEFGDSVSSMDIPGSFTNALLRTGPGLPVRMEPRDIVVHRTHVHPKAATSVLLDMSGSMRYGELYVNVKRMGLALDGLIRSEYPGDFLQFVEMYTFAKPRPTAEIPALMPKPVSLFNPVVRLSIDMSNPEHTEYDVPWHFTNIQHALQTARRYLSVQNTPNRQIMLITDGLPTAHFEGSMLYLLYPPDMRTEEATLREANLCARDGITINIFLLSNWNQSREDIRFAYKVAERTRGRVIFCSGRELDRYIIWDYIQRRKLMVSDRPAN